MRLNLRLKRYVSRHGALERGMVILQLCCWKFSHTQNFVADFARLKLNVIQQKIAF